MPHMKAWDAYETYKIMPNLRLHQLRVASVARALAQARKADVELVTKVGLLHDMGNIMKSDLTQFPAEFYGDQDISYWEGVKRECGERYGADEHIATAAIAREMGLSESVVEIIDGMGFSKAETILENASLELQIAEYADQRVAPYGITSMTERLREGHERYAAKHGSDYGGDDTFNKNHRVLEELERRLFAGIDLAPEDLNDESLKGEIESLRDYELN